MAQNGATDDPQRHRTLAVIIMDLILAAPTDARPSKRALREALFLFVRQYRHLGMTGFREILEARGLPTRLPDGPIPPRRPRRR